MTQRSAKGREKKLRRRLEMLRSCDGCTACCTLMGVDDVPALDGGVEFKPAGAPCRMLSVNAQGQGGCTIYEDRPKTCRSWSCVWRTGVLEDSDSPVRLGVMFAANFAAGMNVLYAYEVRKGAFDSPAAVRLFSKLGDKTVVALVGTTDTYGPPELVSRLRASVAASGG